MPSCRWPPSSLWYLLTLPPLTTSQRMRKKYSCSDLIVVWAEGQVVQHVVWAPPRVGDTVDVADSIGSILHGHVLATRFVDATLAVPATRSIAGTLAILAHTAVLVHYNGWPS